jgi:flagellar hook-associated protein FlgK
MSQEYIPIFVRKSEYYRYREAGPGDVNAPGDWIVLGENERDRYSLFTIGNFIVNPVLRNLTGYKLITLAKENPADKSDNRILQDLLDKWADLNTVEGLMSVKTVQSPDKMSVEDFYNRMIMGLSIEIQRYKTISESEAEVLHATDARRLSVSGVALDEEMANMLRFQHAFQAASRVFNYIDSMLDKLINGTGRVGL